MELRKETVSKIRELVIFTAFVVVCLWKFDIVIRVFKYIFHILFPFILGGAIAFILNVPMSFVERNLFSSERIKKCSMWRKLARPVSMLIVIFSVIGIVMLVMFGVIPQLTDSFANLEKSIQEFIPRLQSWVKTWFHSNAEIMDWVMHLEFDWDKVMNAGLRFLRNGTDSLLDTTIAAARNLVSGVATFFIAVVFAVYILFQKENLNIQAKKVLFAFVRRGRAEALLEVLTLTGSTFSGFLTGQCVEAIILGSMFVVTMAILRLPCALLVGIVIAFTALVPVFGAFAGCVVGVFLIFMVDPPKTIIFLILFLVLQQIEGNLIYPHVVGNSVGLPSIWVLVAVSIGGSLMGIAGMVVFIPIVSVIYALFREIVYLKLKQKGVSPEEIV